MRYVTDAEKKPTKYTLKIQRAKKGKHENDEVYLFCRHRYDRPTNPDRRYVAQYRKRKHYRLQEKSRRVCRSDVSGHGVCWHGNQRHDEKSNGYRGGSGRASDGDNEDIFARVF